MLTLPVNESGKKSCDIQAHGELTRDALFSGDVVREEKEIWSVLVRQRRGKKAKEGFQKNWTVKLAESDKGSFYYQDEWLQDENNKAIEQKPINASHLKIPLQETVENLGERH